METPGLSDALARWIGCHPRVGTKLGAWESALLAAELEPIRIQSPVYVCGLARSGTTLLLEILAAHRDAVTHRYQDFPFVFTPYWWNRALAFNPLRQRQKRERAHGDRVLINAESPEGMEEMFWMAFFPRAHDIRHSQVLDVGASHSQFESFYRNHLRKLLLAHHGTRYVSKGNYNVTRMAYLQKLFPDARFIIPVREPAAHIASLMRQHARFTEAGRQNPRVTRHMNLTGHFEFGLNRIPIHTGDEAKLQAVCEAWGRGEEVRGWALYWDMMYGYVYRQLESNPALKNSAMIVKFETLCDAPLEAIRTVLAHAGMEDEALAGHFATAVRRPDYYASPLSAADHALIRDLTADTAGRYGY